VTGNLLVAGPVNTTSALAGTGLLEDLSSTAKAIENKDWVGAALGGFATTMDSVAAAMDPLGTLIAWGAGWLIDHLEPLKGWLDDLTGDAGAVAGFAQTWVNAAGRMQQEATFLTSRVTAELSGMKGEAVTAYRAYAKDLAAHIGGMQQASTAVAGGLQVASTIVQVVHELVRDTLAQIIGSLSSAILQAVFSLGTLIPKVCADVSARVAALSGRIGTTVKAVVEAMGRLKALVTKLGETMANLRVLFRKADNVPGGRQYTLVDGTTHTTRYAPEDLPTHTSARLSVNESLHDDALFKSHGYDEPWTRDELIDKIGSDPASLSQQDRDLLTEIRDRIGTPGNDGAVQKVLDPQAAQRYLDNVIGNGPNPNEVRGFVTNASDTAHIDTPGAVYDKLRLDYQGTEFRPRDNTITVMRYQSDNAAYEIPRSSHMGGTENNPPPYTGNGFTGAKDDIVPEAKVARNDIDPARMSNGAEMWEYTESGTQRLVGVLRDGQWVRTG